MSAPIAALDAFELDADLLAVLATASAGAAQATLAANADGLGSPHALEREPTRFNAGPDWRSEAATYLTIAATYHLLLEATSLSSDLFRQASALLQPVNPSDARLLAICAGTDVAATTDSGWVAVLANLIQVARDTHHQSEVEPTRVIERTPVLGIATSGLAGLAPILRDPAARGDGPRARLTRLLDDAAAPIERLSGHHGWREQTLDLLPLEPELIAFALVGWHWSSAVPRRRPLRPTSPIASAALLAAENIATLPNAYR